MNIFQIECFILVAETLNFTQAASSLYVTQSGISRAISSIEQEIGLQLLIRNTRSVSLTPAGIAFYEESKKVLDDLSKGIRKAKMAVEGITGTIKIGCLRDFFEPDVVQLIKNLQSKSPNLYYEILEYNQSDLIPALKNDEVDVICGLFASETENTQSLVIEEMQEFVIVPIDHPFTKKDVISINELKNEKFVVMSRDVSAPGYNFVLHEAFKAGFSPDIVGYADYVPQLLMMVASGMGITVLSGNMTNYANANNLLKQIPIEGTEQIPKAFTWKTSNNNPCLKYLADMIENKAGSINNVTDSGNI